MNSEFEKCRLKMLYPVLR